MNTLMLAMAGSLLLAACSATRPETSLPTATSSDNSGPPATNEIVPVNRGNARGVEFVATGTEPFWSLELTSQEQMRFRTVALGDSLTLPLPAPNQAQDAPVLRYRAVAATGELTVTIAQRPCPNPMSGEVLPYTVTVVVRTAAQAAPRTFTGCGRYFGDYRLHDLWALESVDGQPVTAAQFPQTKPYLELNLTSEQALGFSGCNRFSGSLTPERNAIRFSTLGGPLLACPALAFEQRFRKILSGQSFTYQVENRHLTLTNRTTSLVFKKID